jgi:hypothetical protein
LNTILDAASLKNNEALVGQYKTHDAYVAAAKAAHDSAGEIENLRGSVGAETSQLKSNIAEQKLMNTTLYGLSDSATAGDRALLGLYKTIAKAPKGKASGAEADVHLQLQANNIPGRAAGGRVAHGETRTLVGEDGPEVVSLPAGSMVHPNSSKSMGGGGDINVTVNVAGSVHDKASLAKAVIDSIVAASKNGNASMKTLRNAIGT